MPARSTARSGTPSPSNILPGWAGVHVAEELAERLGVPVAVDNESNLEALAELIWGAGSGVTDLLYLKLHSGVGAGVVVNGQLARGAAGGAGEVGHTILDPGGPECSCGNRGCLQTYTSIGAVLAAAARDSGRERSLRELLDAAGAGDPAVARVLARAGERVGATMAGVCNALNPRRGRRRGRARTGRRGADSARCAARSAPAACRSSAATPKSSPARSGCRRARSAASPSCLREGERLVPPGPGPQRPRSS